MGNHTAFFYGTLMAPGVLHRVIHGTHDPEPWQKSLLTVRPALLQSYRRHRVRHADYPAILPHTNSCVRGSVVTGLTEGDLYRLDIFEGDQYTRQKVKVQVLSKDVGLDQAADVESNTQVIEEVEAETYIWQAGEDTLERKEWDFEEFKRDKMKAWMGMAEGDDSADMDEGFADVDRAVAEQDSAEQEKGKDPMGGRGANGHITRQLKEAAV
ncbi:hypothetical protein LTR99_005783 [Exophiala xenobiotica]|nr:hypothetical protein LTR99_005783 [Exophiala xenobiotica]KAK5340521.1 hypothetical protein LTR98_003643 [Exophiala xenobiotica]KAK5431019.1 hypothetical protein LTR34_005578 [Exophiala xenobiotica]KAK5450497.1 hypothetical protein LTR18_000513 [Exophiala xenobiotica]KAK5549364.1 hypothetical protein LTR23_000472 [Chaetothyriales sp. CCFEE 6169]